MKENIVTLREEDQASGQKFRKDKPLTEALKKIMIRGYSMPFYKPSEGLLIISLCCW